MPYAPEIKRIATPPAGSTLWRYMSFAKFASTLHKGELFFPRATNLGDRFEGTLPQPHVDYWLEVAKRSEVQDVERLYKFFRDTPSAMRPYHFISCWSENPDESAALWTYYTRGSETVAIRSTFGRLCDSLKDETKPVQIGRVQYIDFKHESAGDPHDDYALYFAKRRSFSFEREVRAMVLAVPSDDKGWGPMYDADPAAAGHFMKTNLAQLIESVYVAPDAPSWLDSLVRGTLDLHGLKDVEVRRSSLADSPLV